MSLIFATQLAAIATTALAALAIATAIVAGFALKKQSDALEDSRNLIRQQGELLRVQSDQLDVYRKQVEDQHKINAAHGEVLELQAREIRASLEQRERDANEQRRSQAAKVTAWFALDSSGIWGARIRNASDLPVIDVRVFFYYIAEKAPGGDWEAVLRGASTERIRVIPPQTDRFRAVPEQVTSMMDQVSDDIYAVGIRFTDAAGLVTIRLPGIRSAMSPTSMRNADRPFGVLPPARTKEITPLLDQADLRVQLPF